MSSAHLHAVPDPDPDGQPGPWDWPVLVDHDVLVDQDVEELVDGVDDTPDEDTPGRRRALTVPDLRPYVDVRPLAELGPLAVEAGRQAAPPLLRAIGWAVKKTGQAAVICCRGMGVLLVLLAGWLSGSIGKRGSIGARALGAGCAAYAVVRLSIQYPPLLAVFAAVLLLFAVLAAGGHLNPAPAKKAPAGKKEPAATEAAPAPARRGLRSRLADRIRGEATPSKQPSPDSPAQAPAEPVEEAAPDPSPEAVIRALHHLVQGGRGVLHTTLAQHLGLPDTGPVKRVLDEAGIRRRPGVRSVAGNGPGVHRQDFPPLSPAPSDPQGSGVVAGQEPTPTPTTPTGTSGEGLNALYTDWAAEELAAGHRFIRDPERGPAAWKIEHYGGEQK
jgi:hypothetical protein